MCGLIDDFDPTQLNVTTDGEKKKGTNTSQSNVTLPFETSQPSQRLTFILNKFNIQINISIHQIHC